MFLAGFLCEIPEFSFPVLVAVVYFRVYSLSLCPWYLWLVKQYPG